MLVALLMHWLKVNSLTYPGYVFKYCSCYCYCDSLLIVMIMVK